MDFDIDKFLNETFKKAEKKDQKIKNQNDSNLNIKNKPNNNTNISKSLDTQNVKKSLNPGNHVIENKSKNLIKIVNIIFNLEC